jgi:two-component system, response regulator PdtaR
VLFVTANPRILGDGVPGTIGVVTKPVDRQALISAVRYALLAHRGMNDNPPPQGLVRFG